MSVPSRGEVADCAQLNVPQFTVPLAAVTSKKRPESLTSVSVRSDTLASCRKTLQKDGALHRGTTCLFRRYKGLIRGNEDAIFHFYLTRRTFKINTPVNMKTAPRWSLVDTWLLLKPKDDQHKQWHCSDNSVRAGIWNFFFFNDDGHGLCQVSAQKWLKTSRRRPKKEGSRLFNNNKLRWKLFRGAWCFVVHAGLFPARSSRVFRGFDMSVTAAGRGRLCFLSVLFLRLLVEAVKSDCWMTRGNTLAKLESWCFSHTVLQIESARHGFVTWLDNYSSEISTATACFVKSLIFWV